MGNARIEKHQGQGRIKGLAGKEIKGGGGYRQARRVEQHRGDDVLGQGGGTGQQLATAWS